MDLSASFWAEMTREGISRVQAALMISGVNEGRKLGVRPQGWGALAARGESGGVSAQVWATAEGVAAGVGAAEFMEKAGKRVGPGRGGRPAS